jgi:hypothetical protein
MLSTDPASRTKRGTFAPGVSGNPSGRPKDVDSLRARCRELTPRLIEELNTIALDPDEDTKAPLAVLTAHVDLDPEENIRGLPLDDLADEYAAMVGYMAPSRRVRTIEHQPALSDLDELSRIQAKVREEREPPRRTRVRRINNVGNVGTRKGVPRIRGENGCIRL